jgi:transcription-repair coupling factor (superfamily II helicase)
VSLNHLLSNLSRSGDLARLFERFSEGVAVTGITDLPTPARPPLIAAAALRTPAPTLIVASRFDRAEALLAAINEYLPLDRQAELWPAPEALPYEQLPLDLTAATRRIALLARCLDTAAAEPPIMVTTPRGLMHMVMSPEELRDHSRRLKLGGRIAATDLIRWATESGYQSTPLVQEPGTFARRGGIIDIYPPAADQPIRIDLFGDDIESLRTFNPSTQRSERRLSSVLLLPTFDLPAWRLPEAAREVARLNRRKLRMEVDAEWDRTIERMEVGSAPPSVELFSAYLSTGSSSLMSYLPENALVTLDEPAAIDRAAAQIESYAVELLDGFVASGELPAGLKQPYLGWSTIRPQLHNRRLFEMGSRDEQSVPDDAVIFSPPPIFAGRTAALVEDVRERLATGWSVAIASDQVDRLTEIFEESGVYPRKQKRGQESDGSPLPPATLALSASDLTEGWMVDSIKLLVLTDLEIFGFRKQSRRGAQKTLAEHAAFATSLTPGEFVVHVDHGIAKFTGLTRMETNGVEREYLLLEYARGDKLYVPVDQSDRVTRYSGGGLDPQPTKLGSGEWVRTKQRVRKAVREMAFELIQLYAAREAADSPPFPADTTWDSELAESFPYTETIDQQKAIDDVKNDMESVKPMDRLVCGDVGFGKTEVALRAAFKAVNGGRQVAVLVPTTVLALQHFETFKRRLAAFPVRVEMLSRLRSKKDQGEVIEGLAEGGVDIVIGTHRLVQKDVKFKDLGLVVIDEEQRFGVRQKEFLKQIRTEVDVLTMSATPIPRTLHLSLAGIRDISVIDTAPRSRVPIRTFVSESNDHLIREVIMRELERGGQIYVVHNRVHSIDSFAHKLRDLVPEARFGIGHGQMDEHVLEEVILSFVRHDYDVLVCTTIIESGIDIPNVNTIVIDDSDRFGLTQLYQLRGRVGRGDHRAYAYLLVRPHKALSEEAQARLDAIQEATELGAGIRVAMRDMEIRGAGNILGAEQSGHIAEIGFDLYIRLLSRAVEEVKAGRLFAEPTPITLDLPLTALFPASYIADVELRLDAYRRVATATNLKDVQSSREELEDRFGPIPEEVEHLLALIELRIRAADLGIESMVEREREIVIRPVQTSALNLRSLNQKMGTAIRTTPNSVRLRLLELEIPWQDAIDAILDAIEHGTGIVPRPIYA